MPPIAGKDVEQHDVSFITGGNASGHKQFRGEFGNFLKKLNSLTVQSNNHTPRYLPTWTENVGPCKTLHFNIYRSFVHNQSPKPRSNKMFFVRWINKQTVPTHTREYY